MVTVNPPHLVAEYLSEIRAYGEEEGRNVTDDFEVAVYYHINVNDDYEAALNESKQYLNDYYTQDYDRDFVDMWVALGSAQRCIAEIQAFIEADATTILLRLAGYDQKALYRRVTEEVLPAFV